MSYYNNQNRNPNEDPNRNFRPIDRENESQTSLYDEYNKRRRDGSQSSDQQNNIQFREGVPALSREDMQILRQCNRESFYTRCLPLTVGSCALVYYLTKHQKLIKPSGWYYFSAVFFGWFGGKLAYRKKCEDRLANSRSNSPFVTAIRKRRGMFTEDYQSVNKLPEVAFESDWQTDSKSQNFGYGSYEFAEDNKETQHQPRDERDDQQQQTPFTTYDDLRARNRAGLKI